MRVQQGANTGLFTTWLLQLSYDPNWHGQIKLPLFIRTVKDITALCNFVYPPELFLHAHVQHTTFQNRAILAPHNDTVAEFNLHLYRDNYMYFMRNIQFMLSPKSKSCKFTTFTFTITGWSTYYSPTQFGSHTRAM